MKETSRFRRRSRRDSEKRKAGWQWALIKPIEALERRLLLSVDVTTAALESPLFTVGNRWTYDLTANGSTGTAMRTVIGYTTLSNGLEEWEIDETTPGVSGVEKNYYGLDAAGDFVTYGDSSNVSSYSSSDMYSPPLINLPAEMAQSVAYSYSSTDTSTLTNPSGVTTTSTSTKTSTVTLASDTPSDLTVDPGTYSVYQVTTVTGTGSTNVQYDSPQIGLVALNTSGGVNSTLVLTNFETNHDNLSFTNIPTTPVPPGTAIQPPITVELRDNTGVLDTDATGTVMLTLNSASRLGTSPGILGGTTTATIDAGVATFSNLTISAAGSYTLTATDSAGDAAMTSNKFSVGGLQLSLTAVGVNPKGASSGDVISFKLLVSPKKTIDSQQLVVTLPTGFTATGVTGGGTPPSGNTITWTASTVRLVDFKVKVPNPTVLNGLANFVVSAVDDVTYSDGTTDEGTASSTIPLAVPQLRVRVQPPASADVLKPIPLMIEVVNGKGQVNTSENTAQVQLSLQLVSGSNSAVLGGTTVATFVNGVATFSATDGPTISGVGTYKLVATEIGTNTPAAAADTREIKTNGYTVVYRNTKHPGAADGFYDISDTLLAVGDDIQPDAVFDLVIIGPDHNVLSNSDHDAPDLMETMTAVEGTGQLVGSTSTAKGLNGVYPLSANVTSAGEYTFTFSAVDSGAAMAIPAAAVLPLVYGPIQVKNPTLGVTLNRKFVTANADFPAFGVFLHAETNGADEFGANPTPSAGFALSLSSNTASGQLTGTTAYPIGTYGKLISSSGPTFQITAPGTYTLTFTEVVTPNSQPFDPNNNAPEPDRAPVSLSVVVLPDKLEFSQQPPNRIITTGQPFTVSLVLTDSQGNVLSDFDNTPDAGGNSLGVALTATPFGGTGNASSLQNASPVTFVNGVATFSNILFGVAGVYSLNAEIGLLNPAQPQTLFPLQGAPAVTVVSRVVRVSAAAGA